MDSRSFDRLARLLGEATDRRAGLKAALGLLLGGGAVDAAAKNRGKERDRKRGETDRADAAPDAGTDLDATKKKRRCKPVGGKCKKQKHCCAGTCVKPTNDKGKPAKKGICLCVNEGGACATVADCCAAGGVQLECVQGVCSRLPIATGQVCAEGDACADPDAACTFYRRDQGRTAATLCLLGGGGTCVKDQDCIDLQCTNGRCGGPAVVDTGEGCVPGDSVCRALAASCTSYQSAIAPEGDYCLLPDGEPCRGDAQCRDLTCQDGYCGRQPVDTGRPCDVRVDTCRSDRATCTTYASGGNETHCLLGDGETCAASAECIIDDCRQGTCQGGPTLVETGEPCSTDPAVNRCVDNDATCLPYRAGSGGPAGTHCVLDDGASCELPNQCALFSCPQDTCAPTPIPTGEPCRPDMDVCEDAAGGAFCVHYANGRDPDQPRCLLPNGAACSVAGHCEIDACVGVCGTCTSDANCPNGFCADNVCLTCTVDTGTPANTNLFNPVGITLFDGKIWVANHAYGNPNGQRVSFFDPADPGAVSVGSLVRRGSQLMDIAGSAGQLFVTNFSEEFSGVFEVDPANGNVAISRWSGEIKQAYGIVFDDEGAAWVSSSSVESSYANDVFKVTTAADGTALSTVRTLSDVCGPRTARVQPRLMAMGPGGYVYLACDSADATRGSVMAWRPDNPAGTLVRVTGSAPIQNAFGIAFRGNTMFVSTFFAQTINRFEIALVDGVPTATPGCVYDPEGVAVTGGLAYDPAGLLWVADWGGSLVAPTDNYSNAG